MGPVPVADGTHGDGGGGHAVPFSDFGQRIRRRKGSGGTSGSGESSERSGRGRDRSRSPEVGRRGLVAPSAAAFRRVPNGSFCSRLMEYCYFASPNGSFCSRLMEYCYFASPHASFLLTSHGILLFRLPKYNNLISSHLISSHHLISHHLIIISFFLTPR